MAESTTFTNATQILEPFRGVKKVTLEEYFTSGHRTCQGCEPALLMKLLLKPAGPRTIVPGPARCRSVGHTPCAPPDIHLSGMTPYGAHTPLSPPGKAKRIIHTRWKKNMAGMMAAGHPECRYVATVCASYAVEMMNKVRRALTIGGPTFIHSLDPCPKGWDYDPMLSHELGELAIETGIFPLYEVEDGQVKYYGKTKALVEGRERKPVREY